MSDLKEGKGAEADLLAVDGVVGTKVTVDAATVTIPPAALLSTLPFGKGEEDEVASRTFPALAGVPVTLAIEGTAPLTTATPATTFVALAKAVVIEVGVFSGV